MKQGTPVILCIGSDKIAGDSVGPIVGDILKNRLNARCFVYGATGKSVNGRNVQDFLELIKCAHPESPVIAVDACLSKEAEKPFVAVVSGGVNPKRAITGIENPAGDVGILGAVEKPSDDPLKTLMAVSWDKVQKRALKLRLRYIKRYFPRKINKTRVFNFS